MARIRCFQIQKYLKHKVVGYETPVNVWLRSCNRNNANNAWNINSSGNVNTNNAYNTNRSCPDCIARAIRPTCRVGTPEEVRYREPKTLPKGEQTLLDAAIWEQILTAITNWTFYKSYKI